MPFFELTERIVTWFDMDAVHFSLESVEVRTNSCIGALVRHNSERKAKCTPVGIYYGKFGCDLQPFKIQCGKVNSTTKNGETGQ